MILVLKVGLLSQISQMNVFFQPALDRQCDGGGRCKQHAWVSLIYPMYSKKETQFAQNVRLSPLCNKCSNRPTLQLWDLCCLWRPSQWSSLWRRQLRGVQGVHQSQDSTRFSSNNVTQGFFKRSMRKDQGYKCQAEQGLRREQELSKPLPVLSHSEVPCNGHAQWQ